MPTGAGPVAGTVAVTVAGPVTGTVPVDEVARVQVKLDHLAEAWRQVRSPLQVATEVIPW